MNQRLSLFAPPSLCLPAAAPVQAAIPILDAPIPSKPSADSIPTLATTITPVLGLIPSRASLKFEVK